MLFVAFFIFFFKKKKSVNSFNHYQWQLLLKQKKNHFLPLNAYSLKYSRNAK